MPGGRSFCVHSFTIAERRERLSVNFPGSFYAIMLSIAPTVQWRMKVISEL
jgi:hypothetical protein